MLRIILICCSILCFVSNAYAVVEENSKSRNFGAHKKIHQSLPESRPATGYRVFIFDPKIHAWAAYNEDGERVSMGRASGGRSFCRDVKRPCRTIVGTFRVLSKGGPGCRSNVYPIRTGGGAPMPYCMRFSERGYAIHGASSVPNYNASHGCIRVTPAAARWLSQNFVQHGTTVVVRPY